MAETTQFVSRISVKDLISAFESKSDTVRVEFSRPRARSFGNVLNKNVIVRLNEFTTLEDIENGLLKLETDLNFYEVYNKAKHVAFQEQFFNILTSIANIENNDDDAPVRKKRLISRTQTLVSFLNQKLPTNINQVVESKPNNQYKYTPYASHIKATQKIESNTPKPTEPQPSTESNVQPALYVESNNTLNITNSGEEYFVSVKKLKENFLVKNEERTVESPKSEKVATKVGVAKTNAEQPKPDKVIKVTQQVSVTTKSVEIPKQVEEPIQENNTDSEQKAVSVTKLRSLFEQRSSSKGLEVITLDKPQLTKESFGGSVQNISSIPFTEMNLGTLRLQRSVSGNYMNYSGLLKRVDINRSSSVLELNRANSRTFIEKSSDEDSGAESDDTLKNQNESIRNETKLSTTPDNQEPVEYSSEKEVHFLKGSNQVHVKYSYNIGHEENNNLKQSVQNGITVFDSDSDSEHNSLEVEAKNENVSNLQRYEEEVNYSRATEDISKDEDNNTEEWSFRGFDEEEVNSGIAESKNVQEEQNIATHEVQFISDTEDDEDEKTTENELSFKGYEEEEVHHGTTSSENLQTEENVAKFEATTQDLSQSEITTNEFNDDESPTDNAKTLEYNKYFTQGTDDYVDENSRENSSIFSSLHDLEDERERSLIEEVIQKIDVEQTLANADLVVDPEELKNADDEFEKLLENSQSGK